MSDVRFVRGRTALGLALLAALAAVPASSTQQAQAAERPAPVAAQKPASAEVAKTFAQRSAAIAARTTAPATELAAARFALGTWAQKNGLVAEARREFERAVQADPDHRGARAALGHARHEGRWLDHDDAMAAKGLVRRDGAWILREEAAILDLPEEQRALRREHQAKVRRLLGLWRKGDARARGLAEQSLGTIPDDAKLEPFAWALRSSDTEMRRFAAGELARLGNRRALRPLLHRAVHDPDEDVRHAAIAAAKTIGDPNLATPLIGALGSENSRVRTHAADALGRLGDVRAIKYLVYRFEAHGGGAPRVYSMFANQLTFIQDFDVEVAQTAFIADPVVNVIQEGIVLDATVVATEQTYHFTERQVVYAALRKLTGADVPNEQGAWAKWYRENREQRDRDSVGAR